MGYTINFRGCDFNMTRNLKMQRIRPDQTTLLFVSLLLSEKQEVEYTWNYIVLCTNKHRLISTHSLLKLKLLTRMICMSFPKLVQLEAVMIILKNKNFEGLIDIQHLRHRHLCGRLSKSRRRSSCFCSDHEKEAVESFIVTEDRTL